MADMDTIADKWAQRRGCRGQSELDEISGQRLPQRSISRGGCNTLPIKSRTPGPLEGPALVHLLALQEHGHPRRGHHHHEADGGSACGEGVALHSRSAGIGHRPAEFLEGVGPRLALLALHRRHERLAIVHGGRQAPVTIARRCVVALHEQHTAPQRVAPCRAQALQALLQLREIPVLVQGVGQSLVCPTEESHIPLHVQTQPAELQHSIAILKILRDGKLASPPAERCDITEQTCSSSIWGIVWILSNRLRGVHPKAIEAETGEKKLSCGERIASHLWDFEVWARAPCRLHIQEILRPDERVRSPHHVVDDEIDDNSETLAVGFRDEGDQVGRGAIHGIHREKRDHVVPPTVWVSAVGSQQVLIHWHHRDGRATQVADVTQLGGGSLECTLLCEAADVHLVENQISVATPGEGRRRLRHRQRHTPESGTRGGPRAAATRQSTRVHPLA
mmetsp:Transcript_117851/g.375699  ORF Transcript_117851/g.375699 Transcript_117851/m.375699 type:complete len:449 (+) Transcript_117851:394-1740(+)